MSARVILALATEAVEANDLIWRRLKVVQDEMFSGGDLAVRFAYFGAEGAGATRRPYVATRWATDADDLAALMNHARSNCVCGCFVQVGDILEQALKDEPVQAIVIVGDQFSGNLDRAIPIAKKLRARGTRLIMLQPGRSTQRAFEMLAEATGGACIPFNPHIEQVAGRLSGILEAVSHLAVGGVAALEARADASADLLLEQISAAGQIADHS